MASKRKKQQVDTAITFIKTRSGAGPHKSGKKRRYRAKWRPHEIIGEL